MSITKTQRDVLGSSALRPDGISKVQGDFAFSSDLHAENMLWVQLFVHRIHMRELCL